MFCWTEYIPQSVVDMFTAETGIRVFIENYSSNEELLRRRLAGGRHDLVQPSDYAVEALIKADRLDPLDHSRLPNLRNLDPAFTGLRHDPEGRYSVPWMAGTVGIVYNTEKISAPISSLHDAFSGAYAGRIVALGDSREWTTWALRSLGLPINDLSPAALGRVRPVFQSWMPQVLVFDSDSPHRALLEGRADVGIVWSGEAAVLLDASPRFRFVLPAEGAHRFTSFRSGFSVGDRLQPGSEAWREKLFRVAALPDSWWRRGCAACARVVPLRLSRRHVDVEQADIRGVARRLGGAAPGASRHFACRH